MLNIEISKDASKFLRSLPAKHERQIAEKIMQLREDPDAPDSKNLHGYPLKRFDAGEYRIIYLVIQNTLYIFVIGRRNDSDVYRKLERKWR